MPIEHPFSPTTLGVSGHILSLVILSMMILFLDPEPLGEHKDCSPDENQVLRQFNRFGRYSEFPRSAGIPTHYLKRRYKKKVSCPILVLTPLAERHSAIREALGEIIELIKIHGFTRLIFLQENKSFFFQREDIDDALTAISEGKRLRVW